MKPFTLRTSLAVVTVGAILGLTACATSSSDASATPDANVEAAPAVTIMSGQQSQNGDLLKSIFDKFNTKQSATKVTLQMNNDSDVDTAQKALLDITSGHAPDAVRVTSATYSTLVDAGVAQPADSCVASDSGLTAQLYTGILDSLKVNGQLFEIPWYVTPNALFYNASLFEQAGLDPDNPPKTLDEVHEAAKAIAALPSHPAGGVAYFGNDFNYQGYIASLGGTVYDPETQALGIDSSESAAVFDSFRSMVADGASPIYSNYFADANGAFAGGKLGMIVTSSSGYPALAKTGGFDLRIAPAPYMTGGKPVAVSSTNGFVITTKDPARQKAICAALLSVLSPESVTETVSATVTIPLNTSTISSPNYLAPVFAKNPDWKAVLDQELVPWASLPNGASGEYTAGYVTEQTNVLNGTKTGAEASAALNALAESLLKSKSK